MNNNSNDEYLKKEYRQIRNKAHFQFGLQTLIQKPVYNLLLVALMIVFAIAWCHRGIWLTTGFFAHKMPAKVLSVMLLVVDVLLLYVAILGIGTLRSRRTEARISGAFKKDELQYGTPALKSRTRKGKYVVVYELYAMNIELSLWQKRKEKIAQALDIHFVSPYIEYGGRNHSSSKTVLLYTAKGQTKSREEPLYEDEL